MTHTNFYTVFVTLYNFSLIGIIHVCNETPNSNLRELPLLPNQSNGQLFLFGVISFWGLLRWICRVSLKDRKCSGDLYSLLGVQSVDEVVRRGGLRWFGHVEPKSGDFWVLVCRNVVVVGVRWAGRGRKTWRECVKDDMDELGLHSEWVVFRDMWRSLISGKMSNPIAEHGRNGRFKNKW